MSDSSVSNLPNGGNNGGGNDSGGKESDLQATERSASRMSQFFAQSKPFSRMDNLKLNDNMGSTSSLDKFHGDAEDRYNTRMNKLSPTPGRDLKARRTSVGGLGGTKEI